MKNKMKRKDVTYGSVFIEAKDAYPAYKDEVALCEKMKMQVAVSKYCKTAEHVKKSNAKIEVLQDLIDLHLIRNN